MICRYHKADLAALEMVLLEAPSLYAALLRVKIIEVGKPCRHDVIGFGNAASPIHLGDAIERVLCMVLDSSLVAWLEGLSLAYHLVRTTHGRLGFPPWRMAASYIHLAHGTEEQTKAALDAAIAQGWLTMDWLATVTLTPKALEMMS